MRTPLEDRCYIEFIHCFNRTTNPLIKTQQMVVAVVVALVVHELKTIHCFM